MIHKNENDMMIQLFLELYYLHTRHCIGICLDLLTVYHCESAIYILAIALAMSDGYNFYRQNIVKKITILKNSNQCNNVNIFCCEFLHKTELCRFKQIDTRMYLLGYISSLKERNLITKLDFCSLLKCLCSRIKLE